ncbi:MAG: hypothetical protein DMF83_26015 [Acidobacteria bacterium]|nr:MAG: hypothetical protein DMF83_26015 [Acidobacteriota bacterium]
MAMQTVNIRLRWSEQEPATTLSDPRELDDFLDAIAMGCDRHRPIIVLVDAHGHEVALGIGAEESFVQVQDQSGDPPYLVTVGDPTADGVVAFYLFGHHHTEIRRRHLVPSMVARRIVSAFLRSGSRSPDVEWEEV